MFNPYPCPDLQIYAGNYNGRGNIDDRDITESLEEYENCSFLKKIQDIANPS